MPPLLNNMDLDLDDDDNSTFVTYECAQDDSLMEKFVGFSLEDNKIIPVTHVKEMDNDQVESTWYSRAELSSIRRSYKNTVRKMNIGMQVEENDEETTRGLEKFTRDGLSRKSLMRRRVQAVLMEQDRHDDIDVDSLLRLISEKYSRPCVVEATEVARLDAIDVQDYLSLCREELDAESPDELDEIPSSLCMNLCNLRRSFRRLACTLSRPASPAMAESFLDQASERIIQVV